MFFCHFYEKSKLLLSMYGQSLNSAWILNKCMCIGIIEKTLTGHFIGFMYFLMHLFFLGVSITLI
jgi:ABC-type multidrug transport system permease subunit